MLTVMNAYHACLAGLLLALTACTRLYQPTGSGEIPDTAGIRKLLQQDVYALAEDIGERNHYHQAAYERARAYIKREFEKAGYTVDEQSFTIPDEKKFAGAAGKTAVNLEVRKPGTDPNAPWLIIGAHYDTRVGMKNWHCHGPAISGKTGTPGANDNASGIAAVLTLARAMKNVPTKNGIIFVAYANEEPPFFQTDYMGSRCHARRVVAELGRDHIAGMMSAETLGVYSPRPNKKRNTRVAGSLVGILDRCDYVAFMSTITGKRYAHDCAKTFASLNRFPVRAVTFGYLTRGIAWSDDWAYMKEGIPSFAVTDTAYMRCDDYHETSDTADKLDYKEFGEVVHGLIRLTTVLAGGTPVK